MLNYFEENTQKIAVNAVLEGRKVTEAEIVELIKSDSIQLQIFRALAMSQVLAKYISEKLGVDENEMVSKIKEEENNFINGFAKNTADMLNGIIREKQNG